MDPQFLGGLGQVATAPLQGEDDVLLFKFPNRLLLSPLALLVMKITWQVFLAYVGPLAEDEGVFDDILQFPDVARICVVYEYAHNLL